MPYRPGNEVPWVAGSLLAAGDTVIRIVAAVAGTESTAGNIAMAENTSSVEQAPQFLEIQGSHIGHRNLHLDCSVFHNWDIQARQELTVDQEQWWYAYSGRSWYRMPFQPGFASDTQYRFE